jgi:hypothetical protein
VQGRNAPKRFLICAVLAAIVLACLLGVSVTLADSSYDLSISKTEASKGDTVDFTISKLQADDIWELHVGEQYVKDGIADSTGFDSNGDLRGDFTMPDLGNSDKDVLVTAWVTRSGQTIDPPTTQPIRYLAPPGGGGGSGGGSNQGSTGDHNAVTPPVTAPVQKTALSPIGVTPPTTGKKKKSGGSKTKGKSRTGSGGSTHNADPTFRSTSIPTSGHRRGKHKRARTRRKSATPPGIGGPLSASGSPEPPAAQPSSSPPGADPAVMVASKSGDGFDVPVMLVLLLGMLMLISLVAAESRLLGLWGPPPKVNREVQDARLVALSRVARSGALFQRRIADHKRAARDRDHVQ